MLESSQNVPSTSYLNGRVLYDVTREPSSRKQDPLVSKYSSQFKTNWALAAKSQSEEGVKEPPGIQQTSHWRPAGRFLCGPFYRQWRPSQITMTSISMTRQGTGSRSPELDIYGADGDERFYHPEKSDR